MNADELDDLLDGLPDAAEWTPPPVKKISTSHPCFLREKPSKWAAPIFNVDPKPTNSASARAASVAVAASLTSVPGRVQELAEGEWARAREAASAFRAQHEGDNNNTTNNSRAGSSTTTTRFVDLSTGMRLRCHCWQDLVQLNRLFYLLDV